MFGGGLFCSRDSLLAWISNLLVAPPSPSSHSTISIVQQSCRQEPTGPCTSHGTFQATHLHRQPGGAKMRAWVPPSPASGVMDEDSGVLPSPISPITLIHTTMEEQASFLSDPALSHHSYSVTSFSDASLPGTPAGASAGTAHYPGMVSAPRPLPPSQLVHWAQLLSGVGHPHHLAAPHLPQGSIISK